MIQNIEFGSLVCLKSDPNKKTMKVNGISNSGDFVSIKEIPNKPFSLGELELVTDFGKISEYELENKEIIMG